MEGALERAPRHYSGEMAPVRARGVDIARWIDVVRGGGLGGDARHRGSVYEALAARLVPLPESYYTLETLIPMLSVYAPDLARAHLAELLRGD